MANMNPKPVPKKNIPLRNESQKMADTAVPEITSSTSGFGSQAHDSSAVLVNRICNQLDEFFDKWRKSGKTVTSSPLVIVTRAIIAADKMRMTPEVEKHVVMEAALQTFKKLSGEDTVDVNLVTNQIQEFYSTVKPTCAVVIEESQFVINTDQPPETAQAPAPLNDTGINEGRPTSQQPTPVNDVGDVPGLSVLSRLIAFVDYVTMNYTNKNSVDDKTKSSGEKKKSSKEAPRVKYFVDAASLIAYACSYGAKELQKYNPKLADILRKIGTVVTASIFIVPMAAALPPVLGWIVGTMACLVVAISVALS